jgi:hypothetical protein
MEHGVSCKSVFICRLADVWVSEHVILPKDAPFRPRPILEPILTLAWAAATTKRVRLGTSVNVLPMHHPVPIAKQLATLQTLSNGRVILGIGVGWLEAEFSALGVSSPKIATPTTGCARWRRSPARGACTWPKARPQLCEAGPQVLERTCGSASESPSTDEPYSDTRCDKFR